MPGHHSASGRPIDDFAKFVRRRRDELRASFGVATFFGLDPDDVTQETLLRAHRHVRRFAAEDELVAWCRTVGSNRDTVFALMLYDGTGRPLRLTWWCRSPIHGRAPPLASTAHVPPATFQLDRPLPTRVQDGRC